MYELITQCPLFSFSDNPDKCCRGCRECPYEELPCEICGKPTTDHIQNAQPGTILTIICNNCL